MGDKATLAKARRELEELYLGVQDDSVNLSFQHLADVTQHHSISPDKIRPSPMEPISEGTPKRELVPISHPLTKFPSLDFSKAFEQSLHHYDDHHHHHNDHHVAADHTVDGLHTYRGDHYPHGEDHNQNQNHHNHVRAGAQTPRREFRHETKSSMNYDDDNVSIMSGTSMVSTTSPYQERGGKRRPRIPHSNICTICSVYIYIFRHRCLVCGRVYCRQCVGIGMGEMTEGRKCVECLGRRFSQRYIQKAGNMGCCMSYPRLVKQQELKWAEKGARKSGERGYGQSTMMSRSRSPLGPRPRTPTRAHASNNPPSFVINSPMSSYSAYSPTNHPLPL